MNDDIEVCEENCIHYKKIDEINKKLPTEDELWNLSELFKTFGDMTRIKILYLLEIEEICVCDIAQMLQMSQSAISHQLKILKQMKLVKNRRDGKTIYYSLSDNHVHTIIEQGMEHIRERGLKNEKKLQ